MRADAKNAKVAFARVLANAPRDPRALHGLGAAFLYEGEIERAVERFRQVLAVQPDHVSAQLDLAHCLLQLGRSEDAIASLRALVRSAPHLYGKALRALVSSRPRSVLDSSQRRRPIPQSRRVAAWLPERSPR